MTSAELKTLRESLGLSQQWLADRAGVQVRTVKYWESGRNAVPDDVGEIISTADGLIARAVRNAVGQAEKMRKEYGKPHEVLLLRYRSEEELHYSRPDMIGYPVTYHAALLARARAALIERGFDLVIDYHEHK